MGRQLSLTVLFAMSFFRCSALSGQEQKSVPALFEQLRSEVTTDLAVEQFQKLDPGNPDARAYLASQLPAAINLDPKDHPHSWVNEVRVAGIFKVREAIPSLAKWIGTVVGSPAGSTLAERVRLDSFPAGKALVLIGEPSVPSLAGVLAAGSPRERWVAYRALIMIGSPAARQSLHDHLEHESDPSLRLEIQKTLQGK
jgi:HEAT repeat protein